VKRGAPPALGFIAAGLARLERGALLRERPTALPHEAISYCSNDYLGLAARKVEGRAGGGGSRLVCGEREEHGTLERDAAGLVGEDAALSFTTGYAANVGVLSALVQEDDVVVSDALNHASMIDGARLSQGQVVVVPHLDVDAIRAALARPRTGRAWVITESYFSMDADSPDLAGLRAACDDAGAALVVDEAHALGVLGPEGRGLCAAQGVRADVLVGTFGKSFGASGAFVAGCDDLVRWLWNRARPFVFSTALSPVVAAAARAAITVSLAEPARREAALAASDRVRQGMRDLGLDVRGYGHIVPWVVGPSDRAARIAGALRERGIHVHPIRPPSVPAGSARLRLTLTARHVTSDTDRLLGAIREVVSCEHT
jgi:8-amino-7-oxononanoate synthase